jgi:indolepyruvate ferredoxin oxidoreductase alpha subunit
LQNKPGKKIILLGNEAIVRGALEEGVNFVSTYPGTPASEIGNIFYKIAKDAGVYFERSEKQGSLKRSFKGPYFEFSTNEKVALEAAIGASFSGLKTLVAMKNFGLNVALDALFPFLYTGSKGPTVIIVADDPSCHSSAQSEENSRGIALSTHIPILEPADPQECKDFTKLAFQISEKFKIPVIVRTTTRVAHQKMPVILNEIKSSAAVKAEFIKDKNQFVTLPPRVLEMKKELLAKIEKIREFSEKSEINTIQNTKYKIQDTKLGIITSAVSFLYVMEALNELTPHQDGGGGLPVLKLGFFNPLPEKKIKAFLKPLKKVLVVEELEPFLEKEVERMAKEVNCKLEIHGKDLLPEVGELKPEYVISAIAKLINKQYKIQNTRYKIPASKRLPQLCPGCPYWLVISAIKKAVDVNKVIFGGEIGCYMLFGNSPVDLQDYLSCMGSSVGIAHGIKKALRFNSEQANKQKLIAFVGDSSFFHAGIPALINTVFNKSNPLIIILNNQTTAMTGHQPHPVSAGVITDIKIENIVRACGVKYVKTLDQTNQEEFTGTIKEFLEKDEVSVIIATLPCKFVVPKNV